MTGGPPYYPYQEPRLMGGLASEWINEPLREWQWTARRLAVRAWQLVSEDPYAAALLRSRLLLTHGAEGLRFTSEYQGDDNPKASDEEKAIRREITKRTNRSWQGTWFDAGRQMTRKQLEVMIDTSHIVDGDGFAVRTWMPGRVGTGYSTAWRVIDPSRVCNPPGIQDWSNPGRAKVGGRAPRSHVIWQGIELDKQRQPFALWIRLEGENSGKDEFTRVQYWNAGGMRNVIHKFTPPKPGYMRGKSAFAPIITRAKHLQGTSEAHVVAKRAQACMSIFYQSSNKKTAEQFARANAVLGPNTQAKPGSVIFMDEEGDITLPKVEYSGADFQTYVDTEMRAMSASWGIPWQVVLQQLSNSNLASSRAALDQAERTAEDLRADHIQAVSRHLDESIIREDLALDRLPDIPLSRALMGSYKKPRTWSTDKVKDAQAAKLWHELGKSLTSIFDDNGMDYEAERVLSDTEDAPKQEGEGND